MSCSDKLTTLLDAEGYAVEDKACLIEEIVMMDSDCPGICMTEGCDYTAYYEQDQTEGYCELCDKGTVTSLLVLVGIM